ncbi:MAG: RNA methyltransferase [Myxococcota bacterium]
MRTSLEREEIADLGDPRLADYRNLKDAELLLRRDRFIVEGRGNLRVLLARTALRPDSLLLSQAAFAALEVDLASLGTESVAGGAARLAGVPVFVAKQAVLDAIVGFRVHRGALAVCRRPPPRDPRALAEAIVAGERAPRVVVLEGVRDADNVGGIFRAAMALGARAVFLCGQSCDPLYRKAIRTSMGGSLCVPFTRGGEAAPLIEGLRAAGFGVLAFDPKPPGEVLGSAPSRLGGPLALLLGTEGEGLSAAALAGATRRVRIEMEPGVDSLNVAMAAAIGLHALRPPADAGRDLDGG